MTAGYAAFQTNLKIKGTSGISSNWDIRITDVSVGEIHGDAENTKAPTWNELTANIETDLYSKGDYIEYIVTVENKGTVDAALSNVVTKESDNEAVKITFSGVNINDRLFKGESVQLKVKVEYNPEYNGQAPVGSGESTITLEYTQSEIAGEPVLNPNLYVSSKGSDTEGKGTKNNPYLTIAKAYSEADDNSTIYIMDDIIQTETLTLNEDKDITITSDGSRHSIIRENNLVDEVIRAQSGHLTFNNITLNGNNIESKSPLIITYVDTNIFDSELINNNNTYNYETTYDNTKVGGGINKYSGILTIENSKISNNHSDYGGGIYTFTSEDKLIINNTEISNNYSDCDDDESQGGAIQANSPVELNSVKVLNNFSAAAGGGIFINGSNLNIDGNTEIKNNISNWSGAGIYLQRSNCTIDGNTIISDNETTGPYAGGGITVVYDESTLTLNSGTISNNKSNSGWGVGVRVDLGHLILNGGTIDEHFGGSVPGSNNIGLGSGATSSVLDKKSEYTITSKKYYMTSIINNNFVLDVASAAVASGTNIQLYTKNNSSAQKWKVIPYKVIDGVIDYMFLSEINETQYMWVNGNSSISGANVVTWKPHIAAGGFWRMSNQGNGYYQIKNINGLCLGSASATIANGTNIGAYTCNNSNTQKWKFIETT